MSLALLQIPTLVLNKDWVPLRTTTTREAIGLVASGSARIVDPVTFEAHDLKSWDDVSRLRERISEARIRSMRLSLAPPEVIVLTRYDGLGPRAVVFNRRNLFLRDHFACQYCGARPGIGEATIDHVLPRSRGGESTWENCVLACIECNKRKGNRTPSESGLKLRSVPKKPKWSPVSPAAFRLKRESWKSFLSRAYWETELER
jgi:5-methylcytosine-specific restriction endonuclease McrA